MQTGVHLFSKISGSQITGDLGPCSKSKRTLHLPVTVGFVFQSLLNCVILGIFSIPIFLSCHHLQPASDAVYRRQAPRRCSAAMQNGRGWAWVPRSNLEANHRVWECYCAAVQSEWLWPPLIWLSFQISVRLQAFHWPSLENWSQIQLFWVCVDKYEESKPVRFQTKLGICELIIMACI